MTKKTIHILLKRLLFVLLSTAIMVVFSEKVFWYVQGFAIVELILFYALPVAACLAVIDLFQVSSLSGLILVGGLFGFLVEGILTPVIYESGLLDPIMPAYFVGWHGLLSLVFGWYWIRKMLVSGNWKQLSLGSTFFGLFWGVWSLSYRLPESIEEFQAYVLAGETWYPGAWPVGKFAFYALVFTGLLITAHWLLGRSYWQKDFRINLWEAGLLLFALGFIYIFQVLPVFPLGFLKLGGLIALVLFPLQIQKKRRGKAGVLTSLDDQFPFSNTLPLLFMPLAAVVVYSLAAFLPIPDDLVRISFQSIYVLQAIVGGAAFFWAWVDTFRKAG